MDKKEAVASVDDITTTAEAIHGCGAPARLRSNGGSSGQEERTIRNSSKCVHNCNQ